MYCMNNMVVMHHCGLFVYLDFKYLRSYHVINIVHELDIHKSWNQYKLIFWIFIGQPLLHGWGSIIILTIMFHYCDHGSKRLTPHLQLDAPLESKKLPIDLPLECSTSSTFIDVLDNQPFQACNLLLQTSFNGIHIIMKVNVFLWLLENIDTQTLLTFI